MYNAGTLLSCGFDKIMKFKFKLHVTFTFTVTFDWIFSVHFLHQFTNKKIILFSPELHHSLLPKKPTKQLKYLHFQVTAK